MQTKIQKWGNSLGLRIPKSFAAETSVEAGTIVDISVIDGALVVRPVSRPEYRLSELVGGVTRENLHDEISSGRPTGQESW